MGAIRRVVKSLKRTPQPDLQTDWTSSLHLRRSRRNPRHQQSRGLYRVVDGHRPVL